MPSCSVSATHQFKAQFVNQADCGATSLPPFLPPPPPHTQLTLLLVQVLQQVLPGLEGTKAEVLARTRQLLGRTLLSCYMCVIVGVGG